MYKFKFADIGEGLHEGKVGEIYAKVGDTVTEGDSLFSVETDKVTSDIPSPVSGKVTEVLIKQGETVHVGDDVFHFDTGEESPKEEAKEETPAEEKSEPKEEATKEEAKEATAEPKEAEESSGGASVVGEVKVSNNL
ncbi:dihydrolipoyl dehydrogenase [Elysia marginata]|uniref:Lipoamide acyltransferase component of branched-chain alpha-keto acid dehydrogenase complex, mitochondrial n=1 Tax=Elysia marginata TaxID=1093978 RepID=A0AAV4HKP0_9GAST|nr:dihydrolipoyl dehydrogenase [Elysia marginata]